MTFEEKLKGLKNFTLISNTPIDGREKIIVRDKKCGFCTQTSVDNLYLRGCIACNCGNKYYQKTAMDKLTPYILEDFNIYVFAEYWTSKLMSLKFEEGKYIKGPNKPRFDIALFCLKEPTFNNLPDAVIEINEWCHHFSKDYYRKRDFCRANGIVFAEFYPGYMDIVELFQGVIKQVKIGVQEAKNNI